MGTPPLRQRNFAEHPECFMSSHLMGIAKDFDRLTRSPVASPNSCRSSRRLSISARAGFMKMMASSAYRLVRIRAAAPGMMLSAPDLVAASSSRWRESMQSMKSSGNNGSPCRSPRKCKKQLLGTPFNKQADEGVYRRSASQSIHRCEKPNL